MGQNHAKKETRVSSYTAHKNMLKWIKDLNIRLETMKILRKHMR